jgi:hypothetical protein
MLYIRSLHRGDELERSIAAVAIAEAFPDALVRIDDELLLVRSAMYRA